MALRTDGVSIDIDGDYTETLARVDANKNGIGVFGLSFYQNNTDKLRSRTMSGIVPVHRVDRFGRISGFASAVLLRQERAPRRDPGLQEYIEFFVSDEMAGPDGPLAAYGLVSDPELAKTQEMVKNRTPMGPLN
jgi:phosphate transport system substrate-binding protein